MIELKDDILERNSKEDYGERLAGQIENEYGIDLEDLEESQEEEVLEVKYLILENQKLHSLTKRVKQN